MDLNVIEKVLYACSDVHNVKVVDMTIFREEEYQKIIECDLSVAKQVVPIVVAVPQNWQRTLIDIYIAQNMTFPFIPHVDIKGKFCLFETEGVLIDQNLGGIILQSIEKAKEIIEDLIKSDIIKGTGEGLNLTEDMLRVIVICYRMALTNANNIYQLAKTLGGETK